MFRHGVAVVVVVLAACSAPSHESPDGPTPLPDGGPAGCGDGFVDRAAGEWCDDGPANGTTTSLCSKQCYSGVAEPRTPETVQLGSPIARYTEVHSGTVEPAGIAYTAFDDSGVHVAPSLAAENYQGTPPTIDSMKVASRPVALGSVFALDSGRQPIWIEGPTATDPALHLYYAEVSAAHEPIIHEIPYPFPDGTKPVIVDSRERVSALIIDQSGEAPYDLLAAVVVVRSPTDVVSQTLRVPAPGQVRGAVLEATEADLVEGVEFVQRATVFFEDANVFVVLENEEPTATDLFAQHGAYRLRELTRGTWPFRVVGGTIWVEQCLEAIAPEQTHPIAHAVLTDTGDIYMWQFSTSPNGEQPLVPFGHVVPGTRQLQQRLFGVPWGVLAFEPDGTGVYLVDSDCHDLLSPALRPQRFPLSNPWTTSAGSQQADIGTLAADSVLIK